MFDDDKLKDEFGDDVEEGASLDDIAQLNSESMQFLEGESKKKPPAKKEKSVENDDEFSLSESELSPKKSGSKSSLTMGQQLVKRGLISNDQLEVALKQQKDSHSSQSLDYILVDLGFISEETLSTVLSEASGVKTFDLKAATLDANLIQKIPKNIAIKYTIVPIEYANNTLKVATTDVFNIIAFDQIKRYFEKNTKIVPLYANEFQIAEVIDQYYEYEMSVAGILREIETGDIELSGEDSAYVNPTVRLVDAILLDAIKLEASDIHFEPENYFVRLRYRIDGKLQQMLTFHKDFWSAVLVRMKIICDMNIAETRNPQDGRLSYSVVGRKVDFRVATQPTVHGENVVMRILDRSHSLMKIETLGLSPHNENLLKKMLQRPEGMVIVTGPTGSGKTTTLYSILGYINSMNINIMTLEDPVEYQLPIIRQSNVREGTGMNFADGIRSMMRQDPDIIFVGEVRDKDTANMAVRSAMTGHQVYSTLHTNDAIGAIARLVDIGVTQSLLSGNLICIIAQRLARRLCNHCKEEYSPNAKECEILGVDPNNPPKIYREKGCEKCGDLGFKGRIAIHEILPIDREVDEMISAGATRKELFKYARQHGMVPLAEDGLHKVLEGSTSIEELVSKVNLIDRL